MTVLMSRTLLVQNDLLHKALREQARKAFSHATITAVLETPSGEPDASLITVAISEADYAAILEADRYSNTHGAIPEISITEG